MKMTFRWFGAKWDSVTLKQIKQIPGMHGVITTLYHTKPGEEWELEDIRAMKKEVEDAGLFVDGIESVNIHDSIKIGSPDRDMYIQNYIRTLEKLGQEGIKMVCYNFMPVFDWTRSDLAKERPDGATVLAYDQNVIDKINPIEMFEQIDENSNGFILPGWEPERMETVKDLFQKYESVTPEILFDNFVYFLNAIMPTCDEYDIDMAVHIDDPAWSVFGLPRIVTSKETILKLMEAVPNKHNGVTLCTGSLSSNPANDIPDIIRSLEGRIHFAHVRNTKYTAPGVFEEAAHYAADGSLDMYAIMEALVDIGFEGPVRPDHGRTIWDEVSMPGYGLYDRALGSQYLLGLYDAIKRQK
ncbi:mannonate dehydratase [Chakrabartyella piscis]|uniref:mannonate dehydratase n=1 Tax=Chakrabartyella piscis TaxID=2918914 RepID=UPI0029589B0A|nr:mannonate dehydratase [Chakrabartyella piscis]